MRSRRLAAHGYTAADLLVALVLIAVFVLLVLMAMPRSREQARLTACQKNLSQIGLALALYDQLQGRLPTTGHPAAIDTPGRDQDPGPLKTLLETFGLESFQALAPKAPPPSSSGRAPGEVPVPGFICSSDPHATAGLFRAPISYRATTGGDHMGKNGVFAPSRRISLADVEQADGSSFTAGFSERLVGDNVADHVSPANFAVSSIPLPSQGCSSAWLAEVGAKWYGDAGSSWAVAGYRSTLYNHALAPRAPVSCVGADGQAAFMGSSSGHVRGVNLLMLDGSVKLVLPTIDPVIWKEFATIRDPDPASRNR